MSVRCKSAWGHPAILSPLRRLDCNPLVAIQHDGDLSRIEDNTRLNSLVSHGFMTVNEKFKSTYASRFNCFLFMGTNKPVKITDAKSGLIRRLIDVTPTGNKLSATEYKTLIKHVDFELGAIAQHCLGVYLKNKHLYDDYMPVTMMGASNDFYNYVLDAYSVFKKEVVRHSRLRMRCIRPTAMRLVLDILFRSERFKEELKTYFRDYIERISLGDGSRVRNYYGG